MGICARCWAQFGVLAGRWNCQGPISWWREMESCYPLRLSRRFVLTRHRLLACYPDQRGSCVRIVARLILRCLLLTDSKTSSVSVVAGVRGVSMALAERWRIDPEFVETVIEPLKSEAKEARSEGGKKAGRGRKLPEIIPEAKHKRESRTKLAKLHGTNATYVLLNRQWKRDVAKKLL